jgi:N-glycosylase/DNA lyase
MDVHQTYLELKPQIDIRLAEFKSTSHDNNKIFEELLFCICTPQSDAHKCWKAAEALLPFVDDCVEHPENHQNIKTELKTIAATLRKHGVRFHNTKASRICELLWNDDEDSPPELTAESIEMLVSMFGVPYVRDFFAKYVKGWGLKEASHFLRNVGYGKGIVILDRHILRNLVEQKVISEVPKLNWKEYHKIEQKMLKFAKEIDVPEDALDMVFWYNAKKEIFK